MEKLTVLFSWVKLKLFEFNVWAVKQEHRKLSLNYNYYLPFLCSEMKLKLKETEKRSKTSENECQIRHFVAVKSRLYISIRKWAELNFDYFFPSPVKIFFLWGIRRPCKPRSLRMRSKVDIVCLRTHVRSHGSQCRAGEGRGWLQNGGEAERDRRR